MNLKPFHPITQTVISIFEEQDAYNIEQVFELLRAYNISFKEITRAIRVIRTTCQSSEDKILSPEDMMINFQLLEYVSNTAYTAHFSA